MKTKAHILAVLHQNYLYYYYTQTLEEEKALYGEVKGRYDVSYFLQNQKQLQKYHQDQLKKEIEK